MDGVYYLSYTNQYVENFFLSYDTVSDTWYKQNELWINKMATLDGSLYGFSNIFVYLIDSSGEDPMDGDYEGRIESYIELDDAFYMGHSLCPEKVLLRADVSGNCTLTLKIAYDGALLWTKIGEISGERHGVIKLMLPQKRCDSFKLRIEGDGNYCLKNVSVECSAY